jgi:hypothetical protein
MIACPYCSRENAHEAVICQECGTALEFPGGLAQNTESTFKVFMAALLITIGIFVACIIVTIATRFYLLLFVLFPGLPLWGTIEASRIRRRYFSVSSCWPTGDLAITLQCCKPVNRSISMRPLVASGVRLVFDYALSTAETRPVEDRWCKYCACLSLNL